MIDSVEISRGAHHLDPFSQAENYQSADRFSDLATGELLDDDL